MRYNGIVAPFVMEGAMNGLTFVERVKQFLVPTLKRRDVVIMDNLPSHKVPGYPTRLNLPVQNCANCRNTLPIWIRSKIASARSKRIYAKPQSEP